MLGQLLLLVLILVAALAGPASAAPAKTSFTSTWTFTSISWNYDDWHGMGQGNVWHMVDFIGNTADVSDDYRLEGLTTLYGDGRFLPTDFGRSQSEITGKYTSYPTFDSNSIWVGSFTQHSDASGAIAIKGQGVGKSGEVTGLVVKWTGWATGPGEPLHVTGYIIEK
jgi:hypothetical protein